MKKITPDLKFKYVNGFGDFVAAVLHCKIFSWLTKLITGKNAPCQSCSMRRQALNILIPFPLWKIFFKDKKDLLEYLAAEYRAMGLEVEINYESDKISVTDPKETNQDGI
jgi:plastocyanin domain-containing protein